jgi:hypothetical protein
MAETILLLTRMELPVFCRLHSCPHTGSNNDFSSLVGSAETYSFGMKLSDDGRLEYIHQGWLAAYIYYSLRF